MTDRYGPGEAREWAREHLCGVAGCLSATMREDFSWIDEDAIRHDVRLAVEHGYRGLLIVSECGTTPDELRRMCEVAVEESAGRLILIIQASESTLEQNVALVRHAAAAGVDLVMPSFPLTFYPRHESEVADYIERLAGATDLGVILFAAHLWNFGRLHASTFSTALIGEIIDRCPNVVAVKNEVGYPGVAGVSEVFERFADRVVVTDPFEMNAPAWVRTYGMAFLGTSNYEYAGETIPTIFGLLQDPDGYGAAMDLYWQIHPARKTNMTVMGEAVAGTALVPRMLWKYQGWLNGYNGGPLRPPQGRISDAQMKTLRTSLVASGLAVTGEPDEAFFVGRTASAR